MIVIRNRKIVGLAAGLIFLACGSLYSQSAGAPAENDKGLSLYESFQGSSNTLGQVTRLNSALGYRFNRFFSVDAGLPVYFVNASDKSVANGAQSGNGIGNVFVDLYFTLNSPAVNYESRITGTAPTGDKDLGLTTGRATIDWNNYFGRDFGGIRPFANIGIANTVSDTPYFVRPFSTLGTVAHFEGGASFRAFHYARIGASLYDILPAGDQKVYSRLVHRSMAVPVAQAFAQSMGPGGSNSGMGSGPGSQGGSSGSGRMGFETQSQVVGGSDLTRDNGYSGWLDIGPYRKIFLQVGYTRSVVYRLDTLWFGVGFTYDFPGRK